MAKVKQGASEKKKGGWHLSACHLKNHPSMFNLQNSCAVVRRALSLHMVSQEGEETVPGSQPCLH